MRRKERFSAPGNSLDSIMRFSAGNARAVLYGLYRLRKARFVSGHDFSRAFEVPPLSLESRTLVETLSKRPTHCP